MAAACMRQTLSDATDITLTQACAADATLLGGDAAGLVKDSREWQAEFFELCECLRANWLS